MNHTESINDMTRPFSTRIGIADLMAGFANALLDIYDSADRRIGVDDDLNIVADVAAQVTDLCRDMAGRARDLQRPSWRYGFTYVAAFVCDNSRWAYDLDGLADLLILCEQYPADVAASHRTARYYTDRGRTRWVADVRTAMLQSVFFHAGRCLTWETPR